LYQKGLAGLKERGYISFTKRPGTEGIRATDPGAGKKQLA
jgi:hypothetical protein